MQTTDLPDLLAPATPAVLDGWCGPVVLTDADEHQQAVLAGSPPDEDGYRLLADCQVWRLPAGDLGVDFARAEVRDRVARVLSARSGDSPRWRWRTSHGHGFWEAGKRWFSAYDGIPALHVPALADLDPHDDARLPDGSRLVDALALRAVYLEVCCGD